jgi:hypothetical protein
LLRVAAIHVEAERTHDLAGDILRPVGDFLKVLLDRVVPVTGPEERTPSLGLGDVYAATDIDENEGEASLRIGRGSDKRLRQ